MRKSQKAEASAGLLKLEEREVSELKPWANNPKIHEVKQIRALARNISKRGFLNPILIDEAGSIIAGHGRYAAAQEMGLPRVPVIVLRHLSEAEKRAHRIADNRLSEIGSSWSTDKLRIEVDAILALDATYDLELLGFSADELSIKFDSADSREEPADTAIPEVAATAITRRGDIWQIGEHVVICGDATGADTYITLLGRDRPAMMIGDPPFNVKISGYVSGLTDPTSGLMRT